MNYTVGIFNHHSNAQDLRAALSAAGIDSKVVTCGMGSIHIVFVKRHHGKRAVAIAATRKR